MPKGAKDFIDEVNKNPELRKKLFKQSAHVVLDLAKEHGYEFTHQELHEALREKVGVPLSPAAETGADFCVVVIVAAAGRSR
jgi:predicted ribosomally synthesized peptide with nif11-like leader